MIVIRHVSLKNHEKDKPFGMDNVNILLNTENDNINIIITTDNSILSTKKNNYANDSRPRNRFIMKE